MCRGLVRRAQHAGGRDADRRRGRTGNRTRDSHRAIIIIIIIITGDRTRDSHRAIIIIIIIIIIIQATEPETLIALSSMPHHAVLAGATSKPKD